VNDLVELQELLASGVTDASATKRPPSTIAGVADWKVDVVPQDCWDVLLHLLEHERVGRLGDVARVTLGTVTGANKFFVLREADGERLGVLDKTTPVVSRSAWLAGPLLTSRALSHASSNRRGRLLLLPRDMTIDGRTRLGRYVKEGENQGLPARHHCRRDPWWSLAIAPAPDAFLPYTVGYPRGVALNAAGAASTNTVHQVTWRSRLDEPVARSFALSTWSALGRLSAELFGRHYGGGVLKLELAEAKRLPVVGGLMIDDSLWAACGNLTGLARSTADAALLASDLGLTQQDLDVMQRGANALSRKRGVSTHPAPAKDSMPGGRLDAGDTAIRAVLTPRPISSGH